MNNKPIIQKLITNLIIITFVITSLIFLQQKVYNDYVSESISKNYISDLAAKVESRFINFYQPINQILTVFQKWGQAGLLVLEDIKSINTRFIPILDGMPQVHSVKIVNENQDVFVLSRQDEHWISYMIKNHEDYNNIRIQHWTGDVKFIKEIPSAETYDAFQRPWYTTVKESSDSNLVKWTKLRFIESANNFGATAGIKWPVQEQPDQIAVLAFDVLLQDMYESVSNVQISGNSQIFFFQSEQKILSTGTVDSLQKTEKDPEKLFINPADLENSPISASIINWVNHDRPLNDPIDFTFNNKTYWFGVASIDRVQSTHWIGIIIPENDILNKLQQRQLANISISASILLIGILFSILMIRKYRKQLTKTSRSVLESNDPQTKLKELITNGESGTLEFKSTMRMNLNSKQFGKEIELAWLKAVTAFMNSDGGIALLGVTDDGEIVGLEADKFENEDKCLLHFKNLINQHIGAEYTGYLNFGLIHVSKKMVAVLECEPSQKPVFLKVKNEEHFYIRSGPSNVKLQTSKILEYIEDRKH